MLGFNPTCCSTKTLVFVCLSVASAVLLYPNDTHAQTVITPEITPDNYISIASSTSALATCESIIIPPTEYANRVFVSTSTEPLEEGTPHVLSAGAYGSTLCSGWKDGYRTPNSVVANGGVTPVDGTTYGLYFTDSTNVTGGNTIVDMDKVVLVYVVYGSGSYEITDEPLFGDVNSTYIRITQPSLNTTYNTTFTGFLNIPTPSSATSTWRVSFLSSTGEDYSALEVIGTTTDNSQYYFSGNVQFEKDDIVYVRAYLYDDDEVNSSNLVYISPEYEWWVSSTGSTTSTINLGAFRTGATSTCASPDSWSGAICHSIRILFVPSETATNFINKRVAVATSTAPFSYMYDIKQYIDVLYASGSTTWEITVPSTTPYIGDITLLSSSAIDSNSNYQLVRDVFTGMVYLLIPLYAYRRLKTIGRSL